MVLSIITEDTGARALWERRRLPADRPQGQALHRDEHLAADDGARLGLRSPPSAGAGFIDCPLLGSVPNVRLGKLATVGGSEADVARVRPMLAHFTARVDHIGPSAPARR